MGNVARQRFVSESDYLDAERESEVRHEYVDGVLFAMGGASREHTTIASNLVAAIRPRTRVEGGWTHATFAPGESIELASIGTAVAMDEVFEDVFGTG